MKVTLILIEPSVRLQKFQNSITVSRFLGITTMSLAHVLVDPSFTIHSRSFERSQAYPTHVRLTPRAGHMVASFTLLNVRPAVGTLLDAIHGFPLLELLITSLSVVAMLRARKALVELDVARGADAVHTGGAREGCALVCGAIDDAAVGRGAVFELVAARVDVCEEGGLEEVLLLFGPEEVADDGEVYACVA